MDVTTTAAKAVAADVSADAEAAPAPEAVPGRQGPLPGDAAAVAAADPASATATTSTVAESGGEDEEVERFNALLDNIRAMRGMYSSGSDGGRKRARVSEPSWRPTFRMEDFEEAPGRASKKERRVDGASRRPGKETTDVAADGEGDDVERSGRPVVTPSSRRNV